MIGVWLWTRQTGSFLCNILKMLCHSDRSGKTCAYSRSYKHRSIHRDSECLFTSRLKGEELQQKKKKKTHWVPLMFSQEPELVATVCALTGHFLHLIQFDSIQFNSIRYDTIQQLYWHFIDYRVCRWCVHVCADVYMYSKYLIINIHVQ